jgi:putative membrane protein
MLTTIAPAVLQAAAGTADVATRFGPGGGPGGPGGGLWPLAIVGPILWIALIVTLVLLFRRAMQRRPFVHAAAAGESALATRFANGDIDETEYRARLGVLRSERSTR